MEIDVLLDLDAARPVLKFCKVDENEDSGEAKMWNKPEDVNEFVPYMNAFYDGASEIEMRVVFIDPDEYGIPMQGLFP